MFYKCSRNTTGKTPTSLGDSSNQQNNADNVKKIISEYKNHPDLVKIKETFKSFGNFVLTKTSPKDINKIIKSLNSIKTKTPDKIQPKLIKLASNIVLSIYIQHSKSKYFIFNVSWTSQNC